MSDHPVSATALELPPLDNAALHTALGAQSSPIEANVDVRLEFVLGSATLSLAALRQLAVGSALVLDQDLGSDLTIRLDGESIGRGVLVTVDGQLGVHIRQLGV